MFKTTGLAPEFWISQCCCSIVRCLHAQNLLCQAKNIWESHMEGTQVHRLGIPQKWVSPLIHLTFFPMDLRPIHMEGTQWTQVSHRQVAFSEMPAFSSKMEDASPEIHTERWLKCPEIWGCGEFLWCSIHASNYNIYIYIYCIHIYIYILI